MLFSAVITLLTVTLAAAAPAVEVAERGDSGCYPFEDPDCGIDYAVCECANGWFYEFNSDENGCQPPWGILATSESGLPGFTC